MQANNNGVGGGFQATRFIHPSITLSNFICPITAIRIVSTYVNTDPAYSTPDPLFNTATVCADFSKGLDCYTEPLDITLNLDYTFWIVYVADGGASYMARIDNSDDSIPFELHVGCTGSMEIHQANPPITPSFVNFTNKEVGDPNTDVYTIVPPIADRPYCPILRYEFVNVAYEDEMGLPVTTWDPSVIKASSCTGDPCVKVDIAHTMFISTNKFFVKAIYDNGLSFTSTEARVSIKCGASTNFMLNPFFDASVITNATFY